VVLLHPLYSKQLKQLQAEALYLTERLKCTRKLRQMIAKGTLDAHVKRVQEQLVPSWPGLVELASDRKVEPDDVI